MCGISCRSFVLKVDCIFIVFCIQVYIGLINLFSCTVLNTKLALRENKMGVVSYGVAYSFYLYIRNKFYLKYYSLAFRQCCFFHAAIKAALAKRRIAVDPFVS